jgi:hypothetical protein
MRSNAELYEQEFFAWTHTTAALIRAGKWHDIDPERLAEELESLGRQAQREVASHLQSLLCQLLKWWASRRALRAMGQHDTRTPPCGDIDLAR